MKFNSATELLPNAVVVVDAVIDACVDIDDATDDDDDDDEDEDDAVAIGVSTVLLLFKRRALFDRLLLTFTADKLSEDVALVVGIT